MIERCPSCHADVPSMTLHRCRHTTPDGVLTPTVLCDDCRHAIHVALLLTPLDATRAEQVRNEVEQYYAENRKNTS